MNKYIFILIILLSYSLFSQYATNDAYIPPNNNNNTASENEENNQVNTNEYITNDTIMGRQPAIIDTPITGFKNITLGATRQDTINAILSDNTMTLPKQYMTGNVDLSAEESATFLALEENKFYKSGYFVFKNDALYSITINFQPNQVDFLELLSALNAKYTKGAFINANTVAWQNGDIKIILERPSVVKYIDMNNVTTTSDTRIKEKEANPPQSTRKSILEGL